MRTRSLLALCCLLSFLAIPGQNSCLAAKSAQKNNVSLQTVEEQLRAAKEIASFLSPCFSADGKSLSFIGNMSHLDQLWSVSAAGGWPAQLSSSKLPVAGQDRSPLDNRTIAYVFGSEDCSLAVVAADNSDTIFPIVSSRRIFVSADGSTIMASGKYKSSSFAPLLIKIKDKTISYCGNSPQDYPCDISGDNENVLIYSVVNNSETNLYLQNISDGQRELLTPHKPPARFFGGYASARCRPRLSSDGKNVYLVSNFGRQNLAFGKLSVKDVKDVKDVNGAKTDCKINYLCQQDDAEVSGFLLNKDGSMALIAWHKGNDDSLSIFDLRKNKMLSLPKLPFPVLADMDISPDGTQIAAALASRIGPADIWIAAAEGATWRRLTYHQHRWFQISNEFSEENLIIQNDDGSVLKARLYRARHDGEPAPCVFDYGSDSGWSEYQVLNQNGISVLVPEDEQNAVLGRMEDRTKIMQSRLKNIPTYIKYLSEHRIAAPSSLGIMGAGDKGFLSLAAICQYPDNFRACAENSGWADFSALRKLADPAESDFVERVYGKPEESSEKLDFLTPLKHFDQVKADVMVVHRALKTTPVQCGEEIVAELKKHNKHVESFFYGGKYSAKATPAPPLHKMGDHRESNVENQANGDNYLGNTKTDFDLKQELQAKASMLYFLITHL